MLIEGTVFRVHSGNYYVQTASSAGIVVCKLRGNLKKELVYSTSGSRPQRVESAKKRRSTDPIAIGDRVLVDTDLLMIEDILPRNSEFSRDSPSQRGQHTLVANLDQIFIVMAAQEPRPDVWLLDRFLVMAEAADIQPHIVINKIDLADDLNETKETLKAFEKAGYLIFYISARQDIGMDALKAMLPHRVSAVAGPSGVGKSRLLNVLCPGANLKVGDVGLITYKGRHTTTTAELVPLPDAQDGWIADTPGLRQVDFWQIDQDQIVYCFPEFKPYLGECRFANCRHHTGASGCAIYAAMEAGEIDARRYQSFVQMTSDKEADDKY